MSTFTRKEVGDGSRTALSFSVHQKNATQSRLAAKLFPSLYLCVIPGAGWCCAEQSISLFFWFFFDVLAKYIFLNVSMVV